MNESFSSDYARQLMTQMRKGILVYCVLLICSKGDVYSTDIIKRLREAKLIVVEGTIYPLLSRLQKDGVLVHVWKESVKGPPRKYYHLSEDGKAILEELKVSSGQMQSAIDAIEKEQSWTKSIKSI
ncbi:MAG TPA: PadR family transcriptional regulator [Candidatus Saccharimonadales bacterium]|nr:PadR family transcriptional regulator [Candidatus Saccharimonadales bacterium]